MKNGKYYLHLLMLCCFLAGCVSTKYVERKQYLLDTPKNLVKKNAISSTCSISVEHPSAITPFDRLDFLYRIESGRYLIDYYNGFLAAPAEQLDSILKIYLQAYTGCNLGSTTSTAPLNFLQVKLTELYADYRKREKPQAIIALQFHLTRSVDNKDLVLLEKVFRASVPLKAKNTESLLSAWNEGMGDVMTQGSRALNRVLKEQK